MRAKMSTHLQQQNNSGSGHNISGNTVNVYNSEIPDGVFDDMETDLAVIVKILSSNLQRMEDELKTIPFEISQKISCNNIEKEIIENFSMFIGRMAKVYNIFEEEVGNDRVHFYSFIKDIYLSLRDQCFGMDLYMAIHNCLCLQIRKSSNRPNMTVEKLCYYVHIVMADAFMHCKIFEAP